MFNLMSLASVLQVLFTDLADLLAFRTGFIRRQRILSGSALAQALVFRWMADPRLPLQDIAADLGVSPQALQQHLGPASHLFFRLLIQHALARLNLAQCSAAKLGLLRHFAAVVLEDSTCVRLPDDLADLWPGCGGNPGEGQAAIKILLRFELKTGRILELQFHPGRCNDALLAALPCQLPPNTLYLADMGFFDATRLAGFGPGKFWISRVPAGTCVEIGGRWQGLAEWLAKQTEGLLDLPCRLVESVGLPCRLVACRCPQEVSSRRRQKLQELYRRKSKGTPSARQLEMCNWTLHASNVPAGLLRGRDVWTVYRCRWQVELLFKRCKSLCGWSQTHGKCGNRVQAELLAKVLGLIVRHWLSLLSGGPLHGRSAYRAVRQAGQKANELRQALKQGVVAVLLVLQQLRRQLLRIPLQKRDRNKPTLLQLLTEQNLASGTQKTIELD